MRASNIAKVFDRLWPLFHKDPLQVLPAEIMSLVFSHLSPQDLLESSRVSRAWRERVTDSRLWKVKFCLEGWGLDLGEVQRYEREYNEESVRNNLLQFDPQREGSQINTGACGNNFGQHSNDSVVKTSTMVSDPPDSKRRGLDIGVQKADGKLGCSHSDESMVDLDAEEYEAYALNHKLNNGRKGSTGQQVQHQPSISLPSSTLNPSGLRNSSAATLRQPLMMVAAPGQSRVNFHQVFKQKRRLEDNWDKGHYRSFQLPHRDYPQDAHEECVYTIQYQRNYLVSGSRDRTLRIWNLETGRLAKKPLRGHVGSVLCLQFDVRPEEDIIISGSSDTNVILWRFSTGKIIKKIANAHKESVLNLRFDRRFLVTCSKDKSIKIWSRNELRPGDKDYPLKGIDGGGGCPAYIIDAPSIGGSIKYQPSAPEHLMLLEPYTHLMTLELHGAAVNAIQIYKNQLVSASGDRNLRIWNIHTGECYSRIQAHEKGIACVQYDGKRIVSGSSDNTIRIWDPVTKAEVARLEGHTRLVRTLQAAFVDRPGGLERLEAEAAEVDRRWQKAKDAGEDLGPNRAGRPARPGSRKPRDLRARGAKIPPSGGGSGWARIISGSYDEKVIVWKKNSDDEWVVNHQLAQEEALTAAGPPLFTRSQINAIVQPDPTVNDNLTNAVSATMAPPTPSAANATQAHSTTLSSNQPGRNQASRQQMGPHRLNGPTADTSLPFSSHGSQNDHMLAFQDQDQSRPSNTATTMVNQDPPVVGQAHNITNPPTNSYPTLAAARPPLQQTTAQPAGQPNARVFKLQFDARRIICCSQDNKIVGWDFANGDEQIIACSKFFADPE